MGMHLNRPFTLASLALVGVGIAACQTDKHTMTTTAPDQETVCAKCHEKIVKARSTGGPRGFLARSRTVTTHMCEDCSSEMSIYTEEGVLMIQCARCAPVGIACDRCLPPEGGAK